MERHATAAWIDFDRFSDDGTVPASWWGSRRCPTATSSFDTSGPPSRQSGRGESPGLRGIGRRTGPRACWSLLLFAFLLSSEVSLKNEPAKHHRTPHPVLAQFRHPRSMLQSLSCDPCWSAKIVKN